MYCNQQTWECRCLRVAKVGGTEVCRQKIATPMRQTRDRYDFIYTQASPHNAETYLGDVGLGKDVVQAVLGEVDLDVAILEAVGDGGHLQLHDGAELLAGQG